MTHETQQHRNSRSFVRIAAVALAMFGFGYLLVPLYDVFCEITGLNGKTGRVDEAAVAARYEPDTSRLVTVQFVANNNLGMPWEFAPTVASMEVHPGQVYSTVFTAHNPTGRDMVGQAVPSVAPPLLMVSASPGDAPSRYAATVTMSPVWPGPNTS